MSDQSKAFVFYFNELRKIEIPGMEIIPDTDLAGRYELRHRPRDETELPEGPLTEISVSEKNYGGFEVSEITLHDGQIKPYNADTMTYNTKTDKVTIESLIPELDEPVRSLTEKLRSKGYDVELIKNYESM